MWLLTVKAFMIRNGGGLDLASVRDVSQDHQKCMPGVSWVTISRRAFLLMTLGI